MENNKIFIVKNQMIAMKMICFLGVIMAFTLLAWRKGPESC